MPASPPGKTFQLAVTLQASPSRQGRVGGWEWSACQLRYTPSAQGTGIEPVARDPSAGAPRERGRPGLRLPRSSGQTENSRGEGSDGERQTWEPGRLELQWGRPLCGWLALHHASPQGPPL